MKCPKCNGRKYIELDKIGLLVADCPECEGTGEIEEIEKTISPDPGIEYHRTGGVSGHDKPDTSGIGQPDSTLGSGDTSKPSKPKKRKARKKATKRAK